MAGPGAGLVVVPAQPGPDPPDVPGQAGQGPSPSPEAGQPAAAQAASGTAGLPAAALPKRGVTIGGAAVKVARPTGLDAELAALKVWQAFKARSSAT